MFDFFAEISDFLSQIVIDIDYFVSFLRDSFTNINDAFLWVKAFALDMSPVVAPVFLFPLPFFVLDYIRGR